MVFIFNDLYDYYNKHNLLELYKDELEYVFIRFFLGNSFLRSAKIKDKDARVEKDALKLDANKAINKYKTKFKGRELREKVINYLMSKGYKYNDITNCREIEKL